MAIVYLLTNKENGKQYVGKTVQPFDVRWRGHVGSARRGDNGMLVCRAIKKYGPETFERSILEECDQSILGQREMYWIDRLRTHVSQGGYNLTLGGDGGLLGYEFSEESREKIRQRALGRKHSEETRAKMSARAKDRIVSQEAIELRAAANRGKKRTEEQRKNISAGLLTSGYRHSAETRFRIGEKSRGRIVSPRTRELLSIAGKGKAMPDAVKDKIRQARSRAVVQCSVLGEELAMYTSIKIAVASTGSSMSSIQRSLYSGDPKSGFLWKYADPDQVVEIKG